MQSNCFVCRHPQYAAFYKWLEHDFGADAVLHFGMHGTVEWVRCFAFRHHMAPCTCSLRSCNSDIVAHPEQHSGLSAHKHCWAICGMQLPGAPLGNSGLSWSDVLLSSLPNIYVYAANNPSESIVAKRRGYGTIVSHNVPPYGRCDACGAGVHACMHAACVLGLHGLH